MTSNTCVWVCELYKQIHGTTVPCNLGYDLITKEKKDPEVTEVENHLARAPCSTPANQWPAMNLIEINAILYFGRYRKTNCPSVNKS